MPAQQPPAAARVREADRLGPDDVVAVQRLADAAQAADGVAPLSDHVVLHLRHGGDEQALHLLVDGEDGDLAGYAHLDPADPVEGPSAEVVVAPGARGAGTGAALVRALDARALAAAPHLPLRLWSHGDGPAAAALAAAAGFRRGRVLFQMRRPLGRRAPDLPAASLPDDVRVRTFVVGRDEAAWTALNNRAFADHPDQGGWSESEVAVREAESWFDPEGFFLAERHDGTLVGFHWTKVHGASSTAGHAHPELGEVYVVGVAPEARGTGLGLALTVHGLRWLGSRGLEQAMLYVDESNSAAVRLYEGLGFSRHLTDVSYRRDGRPAPVAGAPARAVR